MVDYGDEKYFHIFDTETIEISPYNNKNVRKDYV